MPFKKQSQWFTPVLAGASLRERLVACFTLLNQHRVKNQAAALRVKLNGEEVKALPHIYGQIRSEEIMSRDLVTVDQNASSERARHLLLNHDVRILPVLNDEGRLAGTIGLRELAAGAERIADRISPAVTARPDTPISSLLLLLSNKRTHAVVIVDDDDRIAGVVTQTDLLAALSRGLPNNGMADRKL